MTTHFRTLTVLRWALLAIVSLCAYLIESVVLGGHTFFGGRISLLPVAAVCTALLTGAEPGGLFCLICGILYAFTGADMGVITLVAITFTGVLAGGACQVFFRRHLVPAVLFSALGLLLSDGLIYVLKVFFSVSAGVQPLQVLAGMGLSLLSVLVFFPLCYAISRIGGEAR